MSNMRFLRRHFTPLSAAEFCSCLEQGKFPPRACLITFDDGWQDNDRHALPVLQAMKAPAVFFIATAYIGTKETFWQERLTRRLVGLCRSPDNCRPMLTEFGIAGACDADLTEARRVVRAFVTQLKSSDSDTIERVITRVSDACEKAGLADSGNGDDSFLAWNQVARIVSTGLVTIGSHAHRHIPLTRLGGEQASAELLRSVREIELHGLPTPSLCAYPNGDYDAAVMNALDTAGLKAGFTTEHGYVRPGDDRRRLPRVNIHEGSASTPPEFLCRLLGIF
jgi:peptidoglycan/xylan/chitin deacetylase (PgdA/CDA1 family)